VFALRSNCNSKIQHDTTAFNLYVRTGTGLDNCRTAGSARAILGIVISETDGGTIRAIGANSTEEALEAFDRYRLHVYGDRLPSFGVEAYTLRKDFVQTSPEETTEQVKLVIVPDAIDLDGYTPVVTFGEIN